nr:hypothetical protein [Streptomyces fructofermentans]
MSRSSAGALFAPERPHLAAGRHRYLLAVRLAAHAGPLLRPLRTAVGRTATTVLIRRAATPW